MLPRRSPFTVLGLLLVLLSAAFPGTIPTPALAQVTIQDTPTPLVPDGVTRYAFAPPKIFWQTGVDPCPPALASGDVQPAQLQTESIKRIATAGSTIRQLYAKQQACSTSQVLSNIVADASNLYWLNPDGLVRLSVEANPGDEPQLINANVKGYDELAISSDKVFALNTTSAAVAIQAVSKADGTNSLVALQADGNSANLSFDGTYLYYLSGGNLRRVNADATVTTLAQRVDSYYAEGSRLLFCNINTGQCFFSSNVYIGIGRQVFVYDNKTNTLNSTPVYTSSDTSAVVSNITTNFSKLFVFERRTIPCSPDPCFPTYNSVLVRTPRSGGAVDVLYSSGSSFSLIQQLVNDGSFLFWQEGGGIQRLPTDVTALPVINLRVTGMEVTQGIQNLSNSVLLVKNKRTFVRVYVKSDGAAVPNVTARLTATSLGGSSLAPINSVGTKITVRATPDRTDLNQSFLFELPWYWTQQNTLSLRADLNPYQVPLEPTFADNNTSASVQFKTSPTLSVEFFRLNYTLNGTTYSPRINKDVLQTYSWIMRAYPIGGSVGTNFKPRLWDVAGGTKLGGWVKRTDPDCKDVYGGPNDDISLCASYFTNGWLKYYRQATSNGTLNVGLKTNAFYYGMISDAGGYFPRGQAIYAKTSVGPTGSGDWGWDFDGSYADWYAAHEIGHSLGRAHPNAGSDNPATDASENCGHSRSDPGFPYGNTTTARAPIGPASGAMEGFDVGDPGFGIARRVLPSNTWNDVMSYCNNQWLSDYTYTGMYNFMLGSPSLAEAENTIAVDGDFLFVNGALDSANNIGSFSMISRLSSAAEIPPLVPGGYAIKLLDGSNAELASYAFTPEDAQDGTNQGFSQIVDFVAGTRQVQVVRLSDNKVLTSAAVSANAPTVSNVALQGAPDPVSGVVTLAWTASDPDGDALTYDVSYSRDGGATFQPVLMGATTTSIQIDTAQLGGSGTALFRVTASDGVNVGSGDSAQFTMAPKPPEAYILSPGATSHIHYGQLVNFNGMAFDAQDGTVGDAGLVWKDAGGNVLGTGALVSSDTLPVGSNVITLEATNSAGQKATATVTVVVDDDLNDLASTLSVGPDQAGWHIGAGDTSAQTAQLTITNAGSGTLDWTATSDQPWLTLSAANGTVASDGDPATLTLTADPSGLPLNAPSIAHVTITKPASGSDPAQTVVIPVSLSIGDVFNNYEPVSTPGGSGLTVYLPVVLK